MKKFLFVSIATLAIFSTSCIKDAPLNPEADILKFTLPQGIALGDPIINGENIFIAVSKGENVTSIIPQITITDGSSISPSSSVPQNFNMPVTYTVTSQDGKNQRKYKVTIDAYSFNKTEFEFWETFSSESWKIKYETPVEYSENGNKIHIWGTSNVGVSIYQQFTDPKLYPVHRAQGINGSLVVLETKKGPGQFMNMNIPVVAGSLFTGTLDFSNAMQDPLSATRFGIPCNYMPDRLQGYYNYKAGNGDYLNAKGIAVQGRTDSCSLFGVFFMADEQTQTLDGNNNLKHPNIVAITEQPYHASSRGNDLIPFDFQFVYKKGVTVDFEKNKYKIALVFSSSSRGDLYEGTPGSKMIIDDIRIIKK